MSDIKGRFFFFFFLQIGQMTNKAGFKRSCFKYHRGFKSGEGCEGWVGIYKLRNEIKNKPS